MEERLKLIECKITWTKRRKKNRRSEIQRKGG